MLTSTITTGIYHLLSTLQNNQIINNTACVSLSCNTDSFIVFVYIQIPALLEAAPDSRVQTPRAASFIYFVTQQGSRVKFGMHYLNKAPFGQQPPTPAHPPKKNQTPGNQEGRQPIRAEYLSEAAAAVAGPACGAGRHRATERESRRWIPSIHVNTPRPDSVAPSLVINGASGGILC